MPVWYIVYMKQKTTQSSGITLESLYELIKTLPTKDDLKNFATKDDIDKIWKELKKRPTREEIQYDLRDRPTKAEVEEMLVMFRDDFYNKIDPLLTEVVNAREDREITTYEIRQIKKRLDDHDKLFRQLLHN